MRRSSLAACLAALVLAACTAGEHEALSAADAGDGSPGRVAADAPDGAGGGTGSRLEEERGDRGEPDGSREAGAAGDGGTAPARPDWLGTRELPRRGDGFGEVGETPHELLDRRLPPREHLPPPATASFEATVVEPPDEVLERSTWRADCPVGRDELRYVTLSFWGFDGRPHTGELLVNRTAAEDLVGVFEVLYEERFPVEEMRVVTREELDAPPTGDGNVTTAFVCRPSVAGATWSEHAYGLAVDVNPFHNPYVRGDLVLPELAGAYVDREAHRPGMIRPGDVAVEAFADIGWEWGGTWRSSRDWMHFSAGGR